MSVEKPEQIDRIVMEKLISSRNRQLHYQKAVLQRMERENRRRRLWFMMIILPLFSVMISMSIVMLENKKLIDKESVQKDLKAIIENGGDLKAVQHAFSSQPQIDSIKLIFSSKFNYYESGIALSIVLSDLRVNSFRKTNNENLVFIDKIISEYEQINPFDNLPVNQKYYFENIRIKSGGSYFDISNDIHNIADELFQKNLLVEEYLSDSKMSFWISIIAVVLSIFIGGYQIFSGRPEAMKKLVLDALNGFSEADQEGLKKKRDVEK